jgi:hypothetical protein
MAIGERHIMLLSPLEAWLWQACAQEIAVRDLFDAAFAVFPERGAIIEGEILGVLERFGAHRMIALQPVAPASAQSTSSSG